MQPFRLGKATDPGRTGGNRPLFVEAVLCIARTGSQRRDHPASSGKWNTIFKRFRDWFRADVLKGMFNAASDEPDMEYAMGDATIVRVHRHGQGAKGATQSPTIGKSRGGLTRKILPLAGALGKLVRFVLLPGDRHDNVGVAAFVKDVAFAGLIADKALTAIP